MTQHQYMSRQEAAVTLGLSLAEVDRLIANGLLNRFRIRGTYIRVLRSQVDELAGLPAEWLRNA